MNNLNLDDLTAIRVLGRGAMGTVFLVTTTNSSSTVHSPPFALKVIHKSSPTQKQDSLRRARWELSVLSNFSSQNPFLPTFLGSVETPSFLAYAFPFCAGGDLNSLRYSLSDRVFSPSAIRFYLSELLMALFHLHSLNIVYRDLKPENVLIKSNGHIVLTDFDLSKRLQQQKTAQFAKSPPPAPTNRRNGTRFALLNTAKENIRFLTRAKSARVSPVSRRSGKTCGNGFERSNSFVGTEEYVAPEIIKGDGHDFAVDFWALGILTYEMAYGKTPFKGRDRKETFRNVLIKEVEFVGRSGSDLTDLIGRLLEKDPERRLGCNGGVEEVKEHVFFEGVKWDMITEMVSRPPYLSADVEGMDEAVRVAGGDGKEGFDVREYFENRRRKETAPLDMELDVEEF